ncbi:MAG: hypothetical protein EBR22_01980 [Cytophagia bacterium]|nr:hypothetical protein [Cytophagia bacterium]
MNLDIKTLNLKKNAMKKLLSILLCLGIWGISCKKEDNPSNTLTPAQTYANRLAGVWDVDSLTYAATVSVLGQQIPVNGGASQAGYIEFINSPSKAVNYDIKFRPSLPPTIPFPLDTVRLSGQGTWSNTVDTITLVDTSNQVYKFKVLFNGSNTQQLRTVVNYDGGTLGQVPVTLEMTLGRR